METSNRAMDCLNKPMNASNKPMNCLNMPMDESNSLMNDPNRERSRLEGSARSGR